MISSILTWLLPLIGGVIGALFGNNEIGQMLCIVISVIFFVVSQFMRVSMQEEKGKQRFNLLYAGVYVTTLLAVMVSDLLLYFVFIALALLLSYPLITHRKDETAMKNAGIQLAFTIVTSILFVISCLLLRNDIGVTEYAEMFTVSENSGIHAGTIAGGLVAFLVFATYAGLFPVQFQVTRGCSYGLLEISVILSNVVSKLGVFGMMILAATIFNGDSAYGTVLLTMAVLTIIWGMLITFSSTDIRRILMGLNVAVNGFNTLGVSLMVLTNASNVYAVRGSFYLLVTSSLSLMVLYMTALEQVRKIKTFEIKGLIASGKGQKLLMAGCFIACVNLAGVPGTAGYLPFSLIYRTILTTLGWRWLIVTFTVMWALLMTAVTRVFMKLFISKKEESLRILATEEELRGNASQEETLEKENEVAEDEIEQIENERKSYAVGEILLLLVGMVQIVLGVMPNATVDKLSEGFHIFFHSKEVLDAIPYYTLDGILGFAVSLGLCVIFYLNLVHGIFLRTIRDRKNKEWKEKKGM